MLVVLASLLVFALAAAPPTRDRLSRIASRFAPPEER
jgi:hypothetical protein